MVNKILIYIFWVKVLKRKMKTKREDRINICILFDKFKRFLVVNKK